MKDLKAPETALKLIDRENQIQSIQDYEERNPLPQKHEQLEERQVKDLKLTEPSSRIEKKEKTSKRQDLSKSETFNQLTL